MSIYQIAPECLSASQLQLAINYTVNTYAAAYQKDEIKKLMVKHLELLLKAQADRVVIKEK